MDWLEKYKPKSLDEVMGNKNVVKACREYLKHPEDMPHLLFYGFHGTGKTTIANILVKELLGDEVEINYKQMNASDDRGIDMVRQKIIPFMRYAPWGNAPFKILLLDEADAITFDSQNALKTPLEKYKHNCRVIMICNDVSKIIPPIKEGRCTSFEFSRLREDDIIARLNFILQQEGISDVDLHEIFVRSGGSMRKAISELQKAAITMPGMSEMEKLLNSYLG